MTPHDGPKRIEVLLVEDHLADVRLILEALRDGGREHHVHHVRDGIEALALLRREPPFKRARRPDVILLDLNLPRMDGRELLGVIKSDPEFATIPVVVLTTSNDEKDVARAYALRANCFVTKPLDYGSLRDVVRAIEGFWLSVVRYPRPGEEPPTANGR